MLPFFYHKQLNASQKQIVLSEETSKHIVQVLRMQCNEQLNLTNGLGLLATAKIVEANKKNTIVNVIEYTQKSNKEKNITIAISLLKNTSRFEWFLEKATEIGVTQIIPIINKRTEKQQFKTERMQGIVVSAMLQSQQCFLPILQEPILFKNFFNNSILSVSNKFIAHCADDEKNCLPHSLSDSIILIGPEGDFTNDEIEMALQNNFNPVSLGSTRLRTETAGIVAATLLVN